MLISEISAPLRIQRALLHPIRISTGRRADQRVQTSVPPLKSKGFDLVWDHAPQSAAPLTIFTTISRGHGDVTFTLSNPASEP